MKDILIIDDDTELCDLLTDYLGPEGFRVESAHEGELGGELAINRPYDLVILDVMLPGINGFDVLRRIRSRSTVPVIMLTARGDDVDRIVGLELGADDYLPKPFNPRELVARIHAIQRRTLAATEARGPAHSRKDNVRLVIDDLELIPARQSVVCAGRKVALTAVQFAILHQLLLRAGEVVSRDELAETVLGRKLEMFDRSIDVHISGLRKKLDNRGPGRERIKSVRGIGYQFLVDEPAG
jgi:two-component system response regulator CpxR